LILPFVLPSKTLLSQFEATEKANINRFLLNKITLDLYYNMSAPLSMMQNLLPDLASVSPGSERRSLREEKLPMTPNFATRAQPNGLPMLPALGSIEKEHRGLTLGNNSIQSLVYTNQTGRGPRLQVLDQKLLAQGKQVYIDILRAEQAWWVINKNQIEGR
jgi:hypothetical protein